MRRTFQRYWPVLVIAVGASVLIAVALVAEWRSLGESYPRTNYSRIEEDLYLGGILEAPPPGTRAVLNVCETQDPYRAEVHSWSPIPDAAPAPEIDWLRKQVEFIDEQRRAGRPVYVHCRAGVSRSAMVVAAYLMWRDGCNREEALAAIRARRAIIGPIPAFLVLLKEWEEEVRKLEKGKK